MVKRLYRRCVAGVLVVCAAAAAEPPYYVKKDTWQETMRASREALARWEADQAGKVELAKPASAAYRLGRFYQIGPFRAAKGSSFDAVFEPEKSIDLRKPCGKLRWRAVRAEEGRVYGLKCPGNAAVYIYGKITVPRATRRTGYFGSDDGLAVWLNGKKVLSKKVLRGVSPNQDKVRLDLKKGDNDLLIKIWNNGGSCGWYFSLTGKPRGRSKVDPATVRRQELWDLLARDFHDAESVRQMNWERQDGIWRADWPAGDLAALARRYVRPTSGTQVGGEVRRLASAAVTRDALDNIRSLYYRAKRLEDALAKLGRINCRALRLAIEDLSSTFGDRYPRGAEFLRRLERIERQVSAATDSAGRTDTQRLVGVVEEFAKLQREALLSNPLLDFRELLVVRRSMNSPRLGLPQNWQGDCALPRSGFDNEIAVLDMDGIRSGTARLRTLYRPAKPVFVGDVELNYDADKLMFSSIGANGRWEIFEIGIDGENLHQVTSSSLPDVDNYDPLYLPDGRIIFASTRCFQGIPCVGGGNQVANLYLMNADRDPNSVRRLTFDQDHNWCPTMMHDGHVMYSRWEYSDTPHYFTRLLMSMNPDGTRQFELYGSNSYWPNSIFYARPCPGDTTRVIAVISGHHGEARAGELILFDPAKGHHEVSGVVQRIPGYGKKVEPVIADQLVARSWPKFLHPWPLSDKYFLVSCRLTSRDTWDLYLVDVFDNMLKLYSQPRQAIFEPIPLVPRPRPPVIPDSVDLSRKDAVVYLTDVYAGPGLKGIPRGTVKKLRLYAFHYAYYRMGGHINIGIDGPWDVHRILGTVPVRPDGSAMFRVPANTPIAVQPLDENGEALQIMRSWFTAMPGEFLSCVGCHEKQSDTASVHYSSATSRRPDEITPWYGPPRGFSFRREVQPVLDKYCVSCHDGKTTCNGKTIPDFRVDGTAKFRNFTPSYVALHPYVRRPGPESDYHLTPPMEYHADVSELIQMLRKGHGRVKLDKEAWDRLITWIDLNVPDKGTWSAYRQIAGNIHERRLE
ncbi:MAG: hypothetical protein J7M21_01675, partial [Planctomycetes bacterium]|nr:hypothetical protein [Planctomycetota bacterium]